MIDSIELNCGRTPSAPNLEITTKGRLTVFVGPNNCGKSALLEAIYARIASSADKLEHAKPSALASVKFVEFSDELLQRHSAFKNVFDNEVVELNNNKMTVNNWRKNLESFKNWNGHWGRLFRDKYCAWMNGSRRLNMLPDQSNANIVDPTKPLEVILADNNRRSNFQSAVFDGIQHYPIVDTLSSYGSLKLAFSEEPPDPETERTTNDDLRGVISRAMPASQASDGFRAYVGMLGAIYAGDYEHILIDEPEAFLHPALARTLGRQITENIDNRHIFVATHSADFLMGAIESGADVQIVRLQYQDGQATACLLDNIELKALMNAPLLRSANVMGGLFSKFVVVGEADSDRAFYQEINTRLLAERDTRGIENALFFNAKNKQTVFDILALLRKMGVPAAGIVDLDFVEEGGAVWTRYLDLLGIPKPMQDSLGSLRAKTREALHQKPDSSNPKSYKTQGGLCLLGQDDKDAARHLLKTVKEYGLFVVEAGELEAWLPKLGVDRNKKYWITAMLERLGSDNDASDYIRPGEGDVWDFIGECNEWFRDPDRKGMQATHDLRGSVSGR